MTVASLLVPKDEVAWITASATVGDALDLSVTSGHAVLPVLGRDGRYRGCITESGILAMVLRASACGACDLTHWRLFDIPLCTTIRPLRVSAPLDAILTRMGEHDFAPVVDDRAVFVGIVRRRDVLRRTLDLLHAQNDNGNARGAA